MITRRGIKNMILETDLHRLIAATLAVNAKEPRYSLVAIPGVELQPNAAEETQVQLAPPLCPWCDSSSHTPTKCPQARGGGPWETLKTKDAQIAALRTQLDDAHQHIGALLKWLPQTSIGSSKHAAITAARAWLRRAAK